MPTLDWMGKPKVVNHHRDVPYRSLVQVPEKGVLGSNGSDCGNMIIHGDNLEALKALLPEYEGRVDCIYIDVPYNTGNEGWVFNDNVNDPQIKKWLGEVVGKEGEDFTRHDKWLCMMYPRLQLLKRMLSPTGLIFISVDDNEAHHLREICDEIFCNQFQGWIHWRRRSNQPNDKTKLIGLVAEHILVYSSSKTDLKELMKSCDYGKVPLTGKFSNPDNDPRGNWASKPWKAASGQGGTRYSITAPDGTVFDETWLGTEETYKALFDDGRIYFPNGDGGNAGPPRKKYYEFERQEEGQCASNWWPHDVAGCNQDATDELADLFPEADDKVFDNPKPVKLIERIINMATTDTSIVLDSFAGSGTTAHAVLARNRADGGHRRFILVEMGDYADTLTAERIRRVISGYTVVKKKKTILYKKKLTSRNIRKAALFYSEAEEVIADTEPDAFVKIEGPSFDAKSNSIVMTGITEAGEMVPGIDSGFSYYELGPTIFDSDGYLNPAVSREDLMKYVWHTETTKQYVTSTEEHKYLMGVADHIAYYLAYEPEGTTTLNHSMLATFPVKGKTTVVYADRCLIDDDQLEKMGVVFKQIPRQIARI